VTLLRRLRTTLQIRGIRGTATRRHLRHRQHENRPRTTSMSTPRKQLAARPSMRREGGTEAHRPGHTPRRARGRAHVARYLSPVMASMADASAGVAARSSLGRRGRAANDQPWFEDEACWVEQRAAVALRALADRQRDASSDDLLDWHPDRRQAGHGGGSERNVV